MVVVVVAALVLVDLPEHQVLVVLVELVYKFQQHLEIQILHQLHLVVD
jgi:hypothetical protein